MRFRKPNFCWALASKVIPVVFLLLACAGGLRAKEPEFGYVLDVSGDWRLNGSTRLFKGSGVSVGGVITANAPDSNSYIVIADLNGGFFDRRTCRNAGECTRPIRLPRSAINQDSLAARVVRAGMYLLLISPPARHASALSRGADLQDGLIKLNDHKLDLSPVFKNLQSDRYLVRFERLEKNQTGKRPTKPLPFEWDANKPTPLATPGLAPGLYKVSIQDVSLLESEDETESSQSEAWVLVTSAKDYPRATQTFDAALNVTRQWGTNVRQSAVRAFLRATLEFITTQRSR